MRKLDECNRPVGPDDANRPALYTVPTTTITKTRENSVAKWPYSIVIRMVMPPSGGKYEKYKVSVLHGKKRLDVGIPVEIEAKDLPSARTQVNELMNLAGLTPIAPEGRDGAWTIGKRRDGCEYSQVFLMDIVGLR